MVFLAIFSCQRHLTPVMRRILIVVAILIAVLVIGALIAVSVIDVNKYRPRIQAELQTKLNRSVTLGQLHLRLFPLSVQVDGVTIAEAPGIPSSAPFAKASQLYASVGLLSLFSGNPEIKSVELQRPQIELIRTASGTWNFSSIGGTSKEPSSNSSQNSSGGLTLNQLKITDGQVALTDQMNHQPRAVYDHIDAELNDFAPRKPFNVQLSVHLPGQGNQSIALNAKAGPIGGVEAAAIPIDGHFKLENVTLSGLSRFAAGAIPPNTDSTVSGDGSVQSANQILAVKGNLKLDNTTIKGVKLDYPIDSKFDLSDDRKSDLITIRPSQVKLGPTPLALSGTYSSSTKPANLDLKLNAQNASIVELAKLAGAFGVAMNPKYQFKGTVNADIAAKGPETNPQLSGTMQARQVEASGGEIKEPVLVPEMNLTLSPTAIQSSPFVAQSGATKLTIAFTLAQYATQNPNVDATIRTDGANVAELLNIAKAYGVDAIQGMSGTGQLSLNAHVTGPIKDSAKLAYSGTGNLSNVNLTTPELTKPIAIRAAALQLAQNGAAINNLAASVGSTSLQGNMSVKNFAAPQVQFALSSDKIDVNELQNLQAKTTSNSQPGNSGKQSTAKEPSLLSRTTGSGTLAANTIVAQDFVLTNVKATAKLDHGLITLSPLTASIFGGSETGTLALDTRPTTPTCSTNLKLAGIDTNKMLSTVSTVKNRLYGSLSANANLDFALASGSDALARTLNGTLSFNVANGRLEGINILNELSKVGKFLGVAPGQGGSSTPLRKLSGSMNIKSGLASTNDLIADLAEGSLSGKGNLNLADQGIDMHATAVLNNGVSQSVGGQKVGGFLNTALANNKGELVIPVLITGSMSSPRFAPDLQQIGQMKLKNLLPTTGDPSKLTSGIVGSVLGNKGGGAAGIVGSILGGGQQQNTQAQPNGQAQPPQKPKDVINSVLGQFGKKKQPQQ